MSNFFAELQRRKVYRTAVVYVLFAVGLWGALEVASGAFGMPPAVLQSVIVGSLVGLPVALVAAWFLEVRREASAPSTMSRIAGWPIRGVALGTGAGIITFVLLSVVTGTTTPTRSSLCDWSDEVRDGEDGPYEFKVVSCSLKDAPIADVIAEFADSVGRTIVLGEGASGTVSATIEPMAWDLALRYVLRATGLAAEEDERGGITVGSIDFILGGERVEPTFPQTFRLRHLNASEMAEMVRPLLSERGEVSIGESSNVLLVVDIERVHDAVTSLLDGLDPQVDTAALSDPGSTPNDSLIVR